MQSNGGLGMKINSYDRRTVASKTGKLPCMVDESTEFEDLILKACKPLLYFDQIRSSAQNQHFEVKIPAMESKSKSQIQRSSLRHQNIRQSHHSFLAEQTGQNSSKYTTNNEMVKFSQGDVDTVMGASPEKRVIINRAFFNIDAEAVRDQSSIESQASPLKKSETHADRPEKLYITAGMEEN
jgi:hypothetical protein